MGKRVLACFLAMVGVFHASVIVPAQEKAPEPTPTSLPKPGKFLTQSDLEHVVAALEYLNLRPEDLAYEKKHIDHRQRLKVCNEALDNPLNLPNVTEAASRDFALRSEPATRGMAVCELLDLGTGRWSADEMVKDGAEVAKIREAIDDLYSKMRPLARNAPERAALQAKLDTQEAARDTLLRESATGPDPKWLGGVVVDGEARPGQRTGEGMLPNFAAALHAMTRAGTSLDAKHAEYLASQIAAHMADAESLIPGAVKHELPGVDVLELGGRTHITGLMVAGARVSAALRLLAGELRGAASAAAPQHYAGVAHKIPGVTGNVVAAWQTAWGKFVIGGTGPNTYEGDDFVGIIDLGGDDVYRGRVACGVGLPGRAAISFVLDLGGNDRYEGGDFTQGFGFLGVGILHDLGGGNDFYSAGFCAQGCGLCGYGELHDDGGNDIYLADSGAQGAAAFGYGHLIDAAGNDVYRGARYVQAFAQVMGVGALTDGAGNDLYYAGGKYLHQPLWNDRYQSLSQGFAIGNRYGGTGGGVALLLDEGDGNDVYQCDIYGQGSSYWYSLGMLVDRGGNDTYTLGQYGQGAGIHLSAAILVDLAGNDTYSMGVGLGQGAAHDWAVGWLIDRAGDDWYQGNGQGMGLNFSFAILLDCAGNDSHSTNGEGSIGKGSNNDISLLLDLGGMDVYGPKEIKDGQMTKRARHALVYDVPEGWFPGVDPSTLPTKQEPAPAKVKVQHILISWKGASARVAPKDAERTKEQAIALRDSVLKQARTKGGNWKQLQADHNEDFAPHNVYDADAKAPLVKPFLDLSMKLGVGQIDWCETEYGFHIIKRIE